MNQNSIQVTHIDGLVQDCSNSSALAMELLQSCTKSSIYKSPCLNVQIVSITASIMIFSIFSSFASTIIDIAEDKCLGFLFGPD